MNSYESWYGLLDNKFKLLGLVSIEVHGETVTFTLNGIGNLQFIKDYVKVISKETSIVLESKYNRNVISKNDYDSLKKFSKDFLTFKRILNNGSDSGWIRM